MFGHQASDERKHVAEIGQIEPFHRLPPGSGELKHHEFSAGFEDPGALPESLVEIGQVTNPEADGSSVEGRGGEWKVERVGIERDDRCRFAAPALQHGEDEIRPDDAALEAPLAGQGGGQVQGSGAQIEITSVRRSLPAEQLHRLATPAAVYIEAQEMIEKIVSGGDRREHAPDVRPLRGASGTRY